MAISTNFFSAVVKKTARAVVLKYFQKIKDNCPSSQVARGVAKIQDFKKIIDIILHRSTLEYVQL